MKINIIGSILGITGYDSHCRQLANALYELNSDIKLDVPLPPDWVRQVNDAELNMIQKESRTPDVTIAIMQPQYWRLALADNCKKFVGFLVWEGDKIPEYWIEYILDERVDQIWVPSQHTEDAIIKTLTKGNEPTTKMLPTINKIKIVPHGVDLAIFSPRKVKRDKRFTFVCNKGWRGGYEDRGGVAYVLKAFCEEFDKKDDVVLILKLNPSYLNPEQLKEKMDELKLSEDRPEIKINIDNISYKKLPELYSQGDVYVCAQRADAFNLPGIEAMACGLATLQTGYGGQCDYMSPDNSHYINYKLEEVKGDIQYEGIKWAIPDVEDIKKKMRYVFNHKKEIKEKGKVALKDAQNWTWRHSAKKSLNFIKEFI